MAVFSDQGCSEAEPWVRDKKAGPLLSRSAGLGKAYGSV